ncbi:MAG: hypothetical protein JWL96_1450 [Sphingomonas bacterium]|nr:hypothetical protein [Sphingomonas bacterium]
MAVLRELETHTGIIVAAGFGRFEFAHLSAQEFLCASFISRSPIPDLLKSYLTEYPAPVAVACALSSQPDLFLHQMLKRHLIDKFKNKEDVFYAIEQGNQLAFDLFGADTSSTLYSFLTRMELERPAFRLSKEFGEALLLIHAFYYRRYTKEIDESIDRIMDWEECKDALQLYLENNKVIAYSLTRHIACLVVDHIFRSIYEEVAGPWPDENEKSKVLPVAIIPKFRAKDGPVYADAFNSEQEANVEEYIKYNVSSTPFCIIESGRHRRRTTGGICEVCGNSVVERFRKKPSVGFRLHR